MAQSALSMLVIISKAYTLALDSITAALGDVLRVSLQNAVADGYNYSSKRREYWRLYMFSTSIHKEAANRSVKTVLNNNKNLTAMDGFAQICAT